jgi:hypothetical protein
MDMKGTPLDRGSLKKNNAAMLSFHAMVVVFDGCKIFVFVNDNQIDTLMDAKKFNVDCTHFFLAFHAIH